MARPKKADEQKQLAPAGPPAAPSIPNMANMNLVNHQNKVIDVDNFIRVRDSVCNLSNYPLRPPSAQPTKSHIATPSIQTSSFHPGLANCSIEHGAV